MAETVVNGLDTDGLTKLPTRYGKVPMTPSDGLVTVQNPQFWRAAVNAASACANEAFAVNKLFCAV